MSASQPKTILGISAYYHDSAAALAVDGRIVAAAQEERFTRKKHDPAYPRNAVDYVLSEAGIALSEVDHVAFYDKPFLTFERLLETYAAFAPRGLTSFRTAMPIWLKDKLFQKRNLLNELQAHPGGFTDPARLLFAEHHVSHAASAFFPSPFEEAVVLTMDGVGEWATTTVGDRPRRATGAEKRDPLPPFAGAALFGRHLLSGLQGQQRRIQDHGARPLRRAAFQRQDVGDAD